MSKTYRDQFITGHGSDVEIRIVATPYDDKSLVRYGDIEVFGSGGSSGSSWTKSEPARVFYGSGDVGGGGAGAAGGSFVTTAGTSATKTPTLEEMKRVMDALKHDDVAVKVASSFREAKAKRSEERQDGVKLEDVLTQSEEVGSW